VNPIWRLSVAVADEAVVEVVEGLVVPVIFEMPLCRFLPKVPTGLKR
jgi:hypothetical protein